MLIWAKRVLVWFVAIGLATFFGPLLVAVIATAISVNTPKDELRTRSEASKLVSAFRDEEKNTFVFVLPILPQDGAECGYEPSELFPGNRLMESVEEQRFTPYWGYFVLDRWSGDFSGGVFDDQIAHELDKNSGQFELEFLRRCITTTLARDICMSHVEELIDGANDNVPYVRKGERSIHYGTVSDIVCLYADGVAAREGIPLQSRAED